MKLLLNPSNNGLPAKAPLQQRVEAYLSTNAALFEIPADLSTLQLGSTQDSLLGRHFVYRQVIGGIPVDGGALTVSITPAGEIFRVLNNTYPQRHALTVLSQRISSDAALDRAWSHLRVHGDLRLRPRAELVYAPERDGFRLIYKTLTNVREPDGAWEHRIDAETGDILSVKDIRIIDSLVRAPDAKAPAPANFSSYTGPVVSRLDAVAALEATQAAQAAAQPGPGVASTVDGSALVFDPDPRTALQSDTIVNTSPAASFDPAYVTRALHDITLNGSTYSLVGPWVTISNFDTPNTAPSTSSTGNWTSKRGVNAFNDVMVYYHIDKTQRYLQSLGFTNIEHRSMPADTDGFQSEANAAFDPSMDNIMFGHGTAAPSPEDADVIIHEYGHAIQFSINNSWGMGGDTGAIGEGFSDYWAGSHHYASSNGPSFHPTWTGHWFLNDGANPLRQMDRLTVQYNSNITYAAHTDIGGGIQSDELWSTPLFQSFLALIALGRPREEIDRLMIEAHYGVSSSVTMRDMATAIVATAQRLYPGGPHADVIYSKFAAHQILLAPNLVAPELSYPHAGDIFSTGMTVRVQWNTHNATNTSVATLQYKEGADTTNFIDTMESGVNGWTVNHSTGSVNWAQTSTLSHSPTTCWKATDVAVPSDQRLVSPALVLGSNSVLSVWHSYDLEWTGDGGVIEISTNGSGGPWIDLGTRMTQNGYNDTLYDGSILPNHPAFTDTSGGFLQTLVDLNDFAATTALLRFRVVTDDGNYYGGTAWWVDDVSIVSSPAWNTIGNAPTGTANRAWTLPLTPGSNCVVRAKLTAPGYNDSGWGTSDPFMISIDSDSDGIPDDWEYRYYPSLTNMTATSDSDGDGSPDWVEYQGGTGPTNIQTALKVTTLSNAPAGGFVVQWASESNRFYAIDASTNLPDGFVGIASNLPATPPVNQFSDDSATGSVIRLYRVRLE